MSPRPNLLFIFTDEQRPDTLAAYGNDQIDMPHLNALADQSIVFERTYVTQPLCTPSRGSLMTGRWPHMPGMPAINNETLSPDVPCLPEMIERGDYATAYHGKWHLGDEVFAQHGFDEWISIEDGYQGYYSEGRDRNARSSYHHWLIEQGQQPAEGRHTFSRAEAARFPEHLGKPAFLGQEASRFIHEHVDQPWMLCVNFLEPHMPFFGPRDDQYDPNDIPLPPNFDAPPDETHPLKYRAMHRYYHEHGFQGMPLQTEADWRRMIANYWGLCSLVDTHTGRILDALRQTGQWDNTIIVFTSDHGDMMGSHQLLTKTIMYEESVRVPMLVKMPGQRSAHRVTCPVSHIDLAPTLLDLLGQPIPADLPGQSLRPLMEGAQSETGRDVFVEQQGPNSGLKNVDDCSSVHALTSPEALAESVAAPVRTIVTPAGWKFSRSAIGEHLLYDLNTDPYEKRNLAPEPAQAERIEALTERIAAWQQATGDTADLATVDS